MTDQRVRLVDACARAVGGERVHVPALKVVIVAAWRLMPIDERRAFLRHVSPEGEFVSFRIRWPDDDGKPQDPALEDAARHWSLVSRDLFDQGDKGRSIAASISTLLRQGRKPSTKQAEFMKRSYSQWRSYAAQTRESEIWAEIRSRIDSSTHEAAEALLDVFEDEEVEAPKEVRRG